MDSDSNSPIVLVTAYSEEDQCWVSRVQSTHHVCAVHGNTHAEAEAEARIAWAMIMRCVQEDTKKPRVIPEETKVLAGADFVERSAEAAKALTPLTAKVVAAFREDDTPPCKYCGRCVLAGPPCCYDTVYDMYIAEFKEKMWLRKIQGKKDKKIQELQSALANRPESLEKKSDRPTRESPMAYTEYQACFGMYKEQGEDATEWRLKHEAEKHSSKTPYTGAIGGNYSWTFIGTSLGQIVKFKCFCGDEIDVSDFDNW